MRANEIERDRRPPMHEPIVVGINVVNFKSLPVVAK